MSASLLLRKIYRFLKSGSSQTKDYLAYRQFLLENPQQHKGSCFNLTIDFELAFSVARRSSSAISREESLRRSRLARTMLPVLLELSERYRIPITFAIVAHTVLSDCTSHNKPPLFSPVWIEGDWYDLDPHTSLQANQDYYGADLIERIKHTTVSHEVASHSFSHVDLGDSETTREVAVFEIRESFEILKKINPELSTFIFPNNNVAHLDLLKETGFTTYRVKQNQEIKKDHLGLSQFPLGLWLSPQAYSSQDLVKLIEGAVGRKQLVNFWCHLFEFDSPDECRLFFEPIFAYIKSCKRKGIIEALTIKDIISQSHE